jgi:hypothetical protein
MPRGRPSTLRASSEGAVGPPAGVLVSGSADERVSLLPVPLGESECFGCAAVMLAGPLSAAARNSSPPSSKAASSSTTNTGPRTSEVTETDPPTAPEIDCITLMSARSSALCR